MVSLADVERARETIAGRVHRTPLLRSGTLSEQLGIDAHGELPWFSKQRLAERGPEWTKVADEYLASLRAPAPVAELDSEVED